jgi:hypothetical protein
LQHHLSGAGVGDDDLLRLKDDLESLSNLTYLGFISTEVADDELASLKRLKGLRLADFQGKKAKVTKQGAMELEKSLPQVRVSLPVE